MMATEDIVTAVSYELTRMDGADKENLISKILDLLPDSSPWKIRKETD